MSLDHPGALTDSDLLSWNWSSHGDYSPSPKDTLSLANDYCEILKQVSDDGDEDSGKHSDIAGERSEVVEVCEEETQVGNSLLHIPELESEANEGMSSEKSSDSEQEVKNKDADTDRSKFEMALSSYLERGENAEKHEEEKIQMPEYQSQSNDEDEKVLEELYVDKDRMMSDLSVQNLTTVAESKVRNDNESTKEKEKRKSGSDKKERIDPPEGEAVISGPLFVCLNLQSEWKRRYLSVVDDCLYIWTSHKYVLCITFSIASRCFL